MVFTGRFDHLIDDKGRLAIPSAMRSQVRAEIHGEGFYLMQDKSNLQLVPEKLFETLAAKVQAALLRPAKKAKASRYFFAGIQKLVPDGQGRVMIPDGFMKDSKNPDLLARTHLGREVTLVGSGDRIEIWDRDEFQEFMKQANKEIETFSEDVESLFGTMQTVELGQLGAAAASEAPARAEKK